MDAFDKVRALGHALVFPRLGKETHPDYVEGERLVDLKKFADAEACFLKAAADVKSGSVPRHRQARVFLALAQAQWQQNKPTDAKENAESARQLLSVKKRPSAELAACLDLLGSVQDNHGKGNAEEAIKLFRDALEVQKKVLPFQAIILTQRYRRLAQALAKVDPVEARTLFIRALDLAEKRLGTSAPVTAECLLDLGKFQVISGMQGGPSIPEGERDAGIASLERAVDIHREVNGETSEEVARALQFAASACQEAGDLEKSVAYYERALKVRERQVGGNATDLATLLMGLAESHTMMGNDVPAMELLQQAVGKLANAGEPLAVALETLGEVYSVVNRFEEAVSCFRKARAIWEKDPIPHQDALQANAAFLEAALHYARPEATGSVPLFRSVARDFGRRKILPDSLLTAARQQGAMPPAGFPLPAPPASPGGFPATGMPSSSWPEPAFAGAPHASAAAFYQPQFRAVPTGDLSAATFASSPEIRESAESPGTHSEPAPAGAVPLPAANPTPPPLSSPIPEKVAGSNLLVSFMNPDGSPIVSAPLSTPQDNVELTIVVPESGMPRQAVLAPIAMAANGPEAPATIAPRVLTGWEELSFEFLCLS